MNKCLMCGKPISSQYLTCKECGDKIYEDMLNAKKSKIEEPTRLPNYTALAHELDFYKNREILIEKLTGKPVDDLIRKLQDGWRLSAPKETLYRGGITKRGEY